MTIDSLRFSAALLVALAAPAGAEDRALVVGNQNYADAADVAGADAALDAADALAAAGFQVAQGKDLTAADLGALLSELIATQRADDRLVILLSGHFAQSAGQSWLLATDAREPDLATVGMVGLSLQTVLEVAARSPGGAVVLLGTEARRLPLGPGLEPGIGDVPVPQGVALIRGDAARIADFAATSLVERGASLVALLDRAPDLTADGFLAPMVAFRPADAAASLPEADLPDADEILWQASQAIGTTTAYQSYLARFPEGRRAADARAEIARLQAEPGLRARAAEASLSLSRDERRAIQRALSLLKFNPRGIDGLFGAGSRAAIADWQGRNGHAATSYLTRDQIVQLTAQADRRAQELEAEAAARQAETERQDRVYWTQTGSAGDEAGLRAYLRRYPDGLFAEAATDRLAVIDAARRAQAAAQDRAAWDDATAGNSIAAYTDYLTLFPQGAFTAEAQTRIDALTFEAESAPDLAAAEADEAALNLTEIARSLIERRLDALDLRPGPADGVFDDQTRRAIRRFQSARDLGITGYLDQPTMVSLLSGDLLRLGD